MISWSTYGILMSLSTVKICGYRDVTHVLLGISVAVKMSIFS